MGFFDRLGENIGKSLKERQENIDMYIKRLERYDDAYLIDRLHKASNMDERMALGYILKSRGYGPQK